ncbi:MAG: flagellar motor protein MotB [Phycisphaeraceae bacterium JB051]
MAKDDCNCPPEGAPEWLVTYGDMMTLLLCFFVILVSLSEIKKEDQYRAVVEAVQKAFGMKGGGGAMPTQDNPEMSLIPRLDEVQLQRKKEKEHSNADDPGIEGREREVTKVREGQKFAVGGRITFEPGSSDLTPLAKRGLKVVAKEIKGNNTKIELTGHAARREISVNSPYADLWALSFARAKAVMDFLTSEEVGIRPERIRLVANAENEPVKQKVYGWAQLQPNRRVEIYVIEALVSDFDRAETE